MAKRIAAILFSLFVAFSILFVSVLRASSINYSFYPESTNHKNSLILGEKSPKEVAYVLPYPGRILPDSPLWPLKAARDKIWLTFSTNSSKKVELLLLFADKRLMASRTLFAEGKPEIAYSSLTKAEKYLDQAVRLAKENSQKGMNSKSQYSRLAYASLKHREVIEGMLEMAPEDARPKIIKVLDYPRNAYQESRNMLLSQGINPPESPFLGE